MIRLIPIVIFVFSTISALGQYSETIRSGRPCQSISAFTVGKNVLQLQQGLDFGRNNFMDGDNDLYQANLWTTNNVIRFGLGRKFEINAVLDYTFLSLEPASGITVITDTRDDRFTAFDFGARYNILEGLNGGPAWCIQLRGGFVDLVQPEQNFNEEVDLKIVTSLTQNLNNVQYLTLNLSTVNFDDLSYTLNYALNITPAFGWAIENYGGQVFGDEYEDGLFVTYFDTGFWYLLNSDVQLDIQGGFGNNTGGRAIVPPYNETTEESFFVGAGISWRVGGNNG